MRVFGGRNRHGFLKTNKKGKLEGSQVELKVLR